MWEVTAAASPYPPEHEATPRKRQSLENSGETRKCSRTRGNWEAHLALNFQFHESINILMVQTKASPVLYFLHSRTFLSDSSSNLTILHLLHACCGFQSLLDCVWGLNSGNGVTFFLCEMSFHGILWIWSPQTIRLIICSLPCVYFNSLNIYWVLILGLTLSYMSKISPSSQGVKIVSKRVDGYITWHQVLKMAFL